MDRSSKILARKIVIDVLCLGIVGFTALFLFLYGEPYKRGFFCDDESIRHPFRESTVTNYMLYTVGVIMPICTMLVGEYLQAKHINGQSSVVLFGRVIPPWVVMAYNKIGMFGFGALSTVLTTDIAKYTIGRLRPHFIDLCRPNIDCSKPENQHVYITNFTCESIVDPKKAKESRLSFPSGHSSFSTYVMVYLALYLHLRFAWKGSKLLKYFLELVCLWMAWFTAMSRISDYKHHWSDVLAGMCLGLTGALIVVFFLADFFKEKRVSQMEGTMNALKIRTTGYDVEPGMQNESNPLREAKVTYGGIHSAECRHSE